jgi:hypothetical protein
MPDHYSSDELKSLARILNDILAQAEKCRPDLSKDEIVDRIFSLADNGERDATKFHRAVFEIGHPGSAAQLCEIGARKLNLAGIKKVMEADTASRRYRPA